MTPALRIAILVLATTLGGCTQLAAEPLGVQVLDRERATYEVQSLDGTSLGQLDILLELEGNWLMAKGSFSSSSSKTSFQGMADARTGERLFIDFHDQRSYFFGPGLVFPSDPIWAIAGADAAGLPHASLYDLGFLIGPQWAALRSDSLVGHGVSTVVDEQGRGTSIHVESFCHVSCPANLGPMRIYQEWILDEGILPSSMQYGWIDGASGIRLIRQAHELGNPAVLSILPPASGRPSAATPLCGNLPCEPQDYPAILSLQNILARVQGAADWQAWRVQNPEALLEIVVTGDGNTTAFGSIKLFDQQFGTAYYSVEGEGLYGFAVVREEFEGHYLPWHPVTLQSFAPWGLAQDVPQAPDNAHPLNYTIDRALELSGLKESDVRSVLIWYMPVAAFPSDTTRAIVSVYFGNDDQGNQKYMDLSATDGSVLLATTNLGRLPDDPNRLSKPVLHTQSLNVT